MLAEQRHHPDICGELFQRHLSHPDLPEATEAGEIIGKRERTPGGVLSNTLLPRRER
jgi:hypothetical protein